MHHYEVDDCSTINFDKVREAAFKYQPRLIIAGASSYPRDQDYKQFRQIADEVGAYLLADIAHGLGLCIARVNKNPFPYADFVTASTSKTMRGPRAGVIYSKQKYAHKVDNGVFPGVLGAPQNSLLPGLGASFKYC